MSEVPAPAAKARPAHVAGRAHAGLPKDIDADVVIEISKVLDGSPVFVPFCQLRTVGGAGSSKNQSSNLFGRPAFLPEFLRMDRPCSPRPSK